MLNVTTSNTSQFVRLGQVAQRTSLGKSTILAWEASGKFPRAVRLSATLRVWLESDIDNWIADKSRI